MGIAAERELLEPLRRYADMILDTSDLTSNGLQQAIRERFALEEHQDLTVTVSSFGFSRGMPPLADLVFDMRFLDNPHWDPELRPLTGRDAPVGELHPPRSGVARGVRAHPRPAAAAAAALPGAGENICADCIRLHRRTASLGVHGGGNRGRSCAKSGFSPTLLHRNLGSRPADLLEKGGTR